MAEKFNPGWHVRRVLEIYGQAIAGRGKWPHVLQSEYAIG
jgi:hypothetical protein